MRPYCPCKGCENHSKQDKKITTRWTKKSTPENIADDLSLQFYRRHSACLESMRSAAPSMETMSVNDMVQTAVEDLGEQMQRGRQLESKVRVLHYPCD